MFIGPQVENLTKPMKAKPLLKLPMNPSRGVKV